jgi:hypothetical protein
LSLVALFIGCGYRFTANGRLPEGIRTVCAPVFLNRTADPGLEVSFTQAFRERLIRVGAAGASCEGEVRAEVVEIFGVPTLGTPQGLVSYRLISKMVVRLFKGERLLSEQVISGEEDYLDSQDIIEAEANRQAAMRRLAEQMAKDAWIQLASAW